MLHKYLRIVDSHDAVAGSAALGSITTAGWTWVAELNGLFQLVATTVAIIAGIYAIVYHRKRIKRLDSEANAKKQK